MKLTEQDLQLIEQYCWDRLSHADRQQVEDRMANEPEFAQEVAFQQKLLSVVSEQEEQSLRELMQEEEQAYQTQGTSTDTSSFSPTPIRKFQRFWPYAIAASVALLVAVWWGIRPTSAPREQLFLAHYEPYRNLLQPVDRSAPSQGFLNQALAAYENQDYSTAVEMFSTRLKNTTEPQDELYFYRANAYLGLKDAQAARDDLMPFLSAPSHPLHPPSQWYMALSFLLEGNSIKAKAQLERIANTPQHYKKEEAIALLNELSSSS